MHTNSYNNPTHALKESIEVSTHIYNMDVI